MADREPMMCSFRTLDGLKPEELLNPPLRSVNFSDSPAVVMVSRFLRYGWNIRPAPSTVSAAASVTLEDSPSYARGSNLVGAAIREYQNQTPEQREALRISKEEKDDVETEWRQALVGFYNHVFVDVMQFLPNVQHGVGHIHCPAHSHFALSYPEDGPIDVPNLEKPVVKKWDTHVLLTLAHLEKGVQIRLSRMLDGEEKTLATFKEGEENWSWETEVWWLKKGTECTFHLEGDYDRKEEGVAAVIVVGTLCEGEENQAAGTEGDIGTVEHDEDEEIEISAEQNAMMLTMQQRFRDMGVDEVDLSGARMVTVGRAPGYVELGNVDGEEPEGYGDAEVEQESREAEE